MKTNIFICKKKKLDKIGALLIIANSQKRTQKSFKRKECRIYYCKKCCSYHTKITDEDETFKNTTRVERSVRKLEYI